MTRIKLTGGVVALALLASAPAADAAPAKRTITPADNGKTVTLAKNGKLTISLEDNNPSTGFSWQYTIRPSTALLRRVSDETEDQPDTQPSVVGSPRARTIVYQARGRAGTTKLRMIYRRGTGEKGATLFVRLKLS